MSTLFSANTYMATFMIRQHIVLHYFDQFKLNLIVVLVQVLRDNTPNMKRAENDMSRFNHDFDALMVGDSDPVDPFFGWTDEPAVDEEEYVINPDEFTALDPHFLLDGESDADDGRNVDWELLARALT